MSLTVTQNVTVLNLTVTQNSVSIPLQPVISTSGADLSYTHDQASPSTTWNVVHNLGKFPSVTIVDTSNDVVRGQIKYIDNNNLVLTFSASFSGKAYIN